MAEKNEVFELIKSVIMSKKGGVLLKDIDSDYRSLAGMHIPYLKLGYGSIEDILDDIPEITSSVSCDGQLVYVNRGKKCEHLLDLISRQKDTKSTHAKHLNKGSYSTTKKCVQSSNGGIMHNNTSQKNMLKNSMTHHSSYQDGEGRFMKERNRADNENFNGDDPIHNVKFKQPSDGSEKVHSLGQRHKNSYYSRRDDIRSHNDMRGQRFQEEDPFADHQQVFPELDKSCHYGRSSYYQDRQRNSYGSSVYKENQYYMYQSSKVPIGKEGSSPRLVCKYEPRDYRRNQPYNEEVFSDFIETHPDTNFKAYHYPSSVDFYRGEKYVPSFRPKSFVALRETQMADEVVQGLRYGEGDYAVGRSIHKYVGKNSKYGVHCSQYVPDTDEWSNNPRYTKNGVKPGLVRNSWTEENDSCDFGDRKIDVVSGSLLVTIRNY